MKMKPLALSALCAAAILTRAGTLDLQHQEWPARWISCPGVDPRAPGIFHFRKIVTLAHKPEHFWVHVSADNRFEFFVNNAMVGSGPARADLDHWRYETFDLAPRLHPGRNVIGATVWNYGTMAPVAQQSDQTALLVQGDTSLESEADTDSSWDVEEEKGRGFVPVRPADLPDYYAAPPSEHVDFRRLDAAWMDPERSTGSSWLRAVEAGVGEPGHFAHGTPLGAGSGINRWILVADPLPPMTAEPQPLGSVVRSEGVTLSEKTFPIRVPPHRKASILFDRREMTSGYPRLDLSGGTASAVRITYAEALIDADGHKANRNETDGRTIRGLSDTLVCDGSREQLWSPLSWRAWRYLQLDVQTGEEALLIRSADELFSAYPFTEKGSFTSSDPSLGKMWEIGMRTARMNAHETYSDCPYWEQLQYLGDTRIQALVTYACFGDDRLVRQALDAFDHSRNAEGLTQSRYPASLPQFIPTFSLIWIGMVHDYWMYRPQTPALGEWVAHTRGVLDWYAKQVRPDGLLGKMPWWNFGDWSEGFDFGVPPQDPDGGSSQLTLSYAIALREAAELEDAVGSAAVAADYRSRADALVSAVRRLCWAPSVGLLADAPSKSHFSEQANTLALLADALPPGSQQAVIDVLLGGKTPVHLSPSSIYFRFYLARALAHVGAEGRYLDTLGPWRRMLDEGLTTWAETLDPTRSDDHAWSAHPNYDLLTLVAGIQPASPGFKTVHIAPHPGALTTMDARMPHPLGEIALHCTLYADTWTFEVTLPQGLTGDFTWGGTRVPLSGGTQTLSLPRR